MLTENPAHAPITGRYVPALTGLRAVAAGAVFMHHYNPAPAGTLADRLFAQGYVGVSVFFVLSGFLIYHRYGNGTLSPERGNWRPYFQNRFARIFPLYALLLLATVGVGWWWRGQSASGPLLGLNLTLLNGFFDAYKFSGIAQSWSLTVEETFYALAPLLFGLLRRWGAFGLTAGLTGAGLLLWATVGALGVHGLFGSVPFVLFYTFFGRAFEFVVGMWLARQWHQGRLPRIRYAQVVGLGIMGGCVLWQATVTGLTTQPAALFGSEVLVYNYLLPVGIGFFFLSLLRKKSIVGWVLAWPVVQALGRSSYAFYLIHLGMVAHGLQKLGVTNRWLLFGSLVIIAQGLHHFVEKPLQRLFCGRGV